jgi:hypothetical protein
MVGRLKPLGIARLTKPGKYADGDGLYLIVSGPAARNWSYRYWIGGKERWHGLGSLKDVSLREARIKRDAARQQMRNGIDIVQTRRVAREQAKAISEDTATPNFQECAERFIAENHGRELLFVLPDSLGERPLRATSGYSTTDKLSAKTLMRSRASLHRRSAGPCPKSSDRPSLKSLERAGCFDGLGVPSATKIDAKSVTTMSDLQCGFPYAAPPQGNVVCDSVRRSAMPGER